MSTELDDDDGVYDDIHVEFSRKLTALESETMLVSPSKMAAEGGLPDTSID